MAYLVKQVMLLAALPALALAASATPQIYLHPPVPSAASISLTAPQAHAVLSSQLGVSGYEALPAAGNGRDRQWLSLLKQSNTWEDGQSGKVVILLDCPAQGCQGLVPQQFFGAQGATLPDLPHHSWATLVTLQVTRLAESLGVDLSDDAFRGLDSIIGAVTKVEGWADWVGSEVGKAVRKFHKGAKTVKAQVMKTPAASGLLSTFDFLDETANTLLAELEDLVATVDDIIAARTQGQDDGPQAQRPGSKAMVLHFQGLNEVASHHGTSSAAYQSAATAFSSTLEGALVAYEEAYPDSSFVLLALPPYRPPLLRKRTPWLSAFATGHRFSSADRRHTLQKRSQASGQLQKRAKVPLPVVPISHKCFSSSKSVNSLTGNCSGHGVPVKGITTRLIDGDCWVCSCSATRSKNGAVSKWGGEACEKEDLSSEFVLLFFSGLGLIAILAVSVLLLAKSGSEELPGTLSSVSGGAAGASKRD